jgi:hypothetical protein
MNSTKRSALLRQFRLEQSHEPLAPPAHFLQRSLLYWSVGILLLGVWLLLGTFLYLGLLGCSRLDAFYQAAMVACGVGTDLKVPQEAKLWVSLYAVFSGVVLLGSAGAFLSPIVHRIQHHFHIKEGD